MVDPDSDRNKSVAAVSDNGENVNQHGHCHRCLTGLGCRCIADMPDRWPRTCGCCLGVFFPVWFLIALSLFFGYFLAELEAPGEIEANNDIFAARFLLDSTAYFYKQMSSLLPLICLKHFADNNVNGTNVTLVAADNFETKLNETILKIANNTSIENILEDDRKGLDGFMGTIDYSDLFDWMRECGEIAENLLEKYFGTEEGNATVVSRAGSSISFNWLVCSPPQIDLFANEISSIIVPEEQETFAQTQWTKEQKTLYAKYHEENLQAGMNKVDSTVDALKRSSKEASGFEYCQVNGVGGGWFWFTVMTTMGYGNAAPETKGGRTMVYTLGFASLIAFGAILGNAGNIVTAIWDDWVERTRFKKIRAAWIGSIVWGALYYLWMLVTALKTKKWKEERLGEPFEFKDAYWFSYISTTTIGLGDIYLEHAQLKQSDLLEFALVLLFGFILLANFFVKLSETISNLFPRNRPTFAQRLATTRMAFKLKADNEMEQELSGESVKSHISSYEPDEEWIDAKSDLSAEDKTLK